MPPLLISIYY